MSCTGHLICNIVHMLNLISILLLTFGTTGCKNKDSNIHSAQEEFISSPDTVALYKSTILTGADQLDAYFPILKDKYVSLVVNQTSVIGNSHLVDTLLKLGVKINNIFAPEHGFRGTEDAGATILNAKDLTTGLPVISLYGDKKKPSWQDLADADIVVFDIQDVGARFYTYISTLHYVMEACAENKKQLIVLDRPNPNGFYVDGPVLEKEFASFIGMDPVPVVHGMTIGEYAQMINGEKWLPNGLQCDLTIIPCKNYSHADYYEVKIPPSPNLKTMEAIYLYPTLCFFEGTNVSVGRGTSTPFEMIGSPYMNPPEPIYTFTPKSGPGAKQPPFMNQECYGMNFSEVDIFTLRAYHIHMQLILEANNYFYANKDKFFLANNFFNKLAGSDELMEQIKAGLTADEIKLSWQDDIAAFKQIRKKYLLYPDFE